MKVSDIFSRAASALSQGPKSPVFAQLTPFRIEPKFVARVWGFTDLRPWYDFPPAGAATEPTGEVWLTGDECVVASGPHKGRLLGDLFHENSSAMLGTVAPSSGSPLLLKIIFAKEKLSVQVHPDDRMAEKYGEPRGKTECWYALSAERGAQVAAGIKPGTALDAIREGIAAGTLENSLNIVSVRAGDMIFVDAGTVHAIWPGSILLETQQNSDLTYRMYDYGRPRELHIDKSIEAVRLETRAGKVKPVQCDDRTVLIDEKYFCVERLPVEVSRTSSTLAGSGECQPGLSYLFAAAGRARIASSAFEAVEMVERSVVAIPASSPLFAVQDLGGLDLIRISPRWPACPH
jgi:mannose-6-phosphate isomerase